MTATTPGGSVRRWLPWLGAMLALLAMGWLARDFDFARFRDVIVASDWRWVLVVPLAVVAEQWARAWKWQQLLHSLRPVGVCRLFGAVMAGYLLAVLIPVGLGTVARSWLVARRESLPMPSVLATVAIDRLSDGIIFACLVPIALWSVVIDDPTGGIRSGLVWGASGSLLLLTALLLGLLAFRRRALASHGARAAWPAWVPERRRLAVQRVVSAFAQGFTWPGERWRGVGVVLWSVVIKLIAASHLLWAGLAIGIILEPAQYLYLFVFLGFIAILGHFLRFIGSYVVGGVYAPGLFGVGAEPALAMVLIVEMVSLLSVAVVGGVALWSQGVALADLRGAQAGASVALR